MDLWEEWYILRWLVDAWWLVQWKLPLHNAKTSLASLPIVSFHGHGPFNMKLFKVEPWRYRTDGSKNMVPFQ